MKNNNLIEKLNYRGYDIEVCYDSDPSSPDEWKNEDCFIVYDHRNFTIKRDGFNVHDIYEHLKEGYKTYDGYWVIPLFAYIHSLVSLSVSKEAFLSGCRWDTSFAGFVLVKRQKNWSYKFDQAFKIAKCITEEWNIYLSGDIYGYNSDFGGCWGFYGDKGMKLMISEAKDEIDYEIKSI